MIRYLTVREIAMLYRKPHGTIRWLASRDQWRRSTDHHRPVLYHADDVINTMSAAT